MLAKASGEVRTRIVHNTQKNGDIYVLERRTIYDSEKKRNKVLSTKLLSKIPKGSEIPVPTRPKKTRFDKDLEISREIMATRVHLGMMEIINHVGSASGIDEGLYCNTDIFLRPMDRVYRVFSHGKVSIYRLSSLLKGGPRKSRYGINCS